MDQLVEVDPPRAYCLFLTQSRPMGVALDAIAEVMEPGRLVRLPLCPSQVLGLCTYRGKIVPVVEPGAKAHASPVPDPGPSPAEVQDRALLILRSDNGLWGLAIDRDGVSVEVAAHAPAADRPADSRGFVALGSVDRDGIPHAILDPERTWRGLRAEIDRWYADALGADGPGVPGPAGRTGTSSVANETRQARR